MSNPNTCLPPLPLGPSVRRVSRQSVVAWGDHKVTVGGDAP
ncbi:MAG: hypothetical protein RI941_905, partial [Pseudomonadota bacterium]